MLSKEFLNERGRNGSSDDEPAAAPAQTPDWLKNAGKYISNKIGLKEPVALPDYTASNQQDAAAKSGYTGIDPVQRQRAGMAPATQQEINRYMKDNPAVVGGLTDRNGNPIASGGAQEVERAARAAAPRRGADFDADAEVGAVDPAVIGNRFKTPNELGFQPGGSTAPTPTPAAATPAAPSSVNTGGAGGVGGGGQAPGVEARPVPASTIQATPLPAQKAFSEPADDAAAKAYAAADAGRQPVKAAGENDEIEQLKKNAGLPKTEKAINPETGEEYDKLAPDDGPEQLGLSSEQIAAANAPRTEKAINPETGEEYDKLATAQSANDGDAGDDLAKIRANAGLAQSANDGDAGEAQAAAPAAPAVAAAPAPAPVKAFVEPDPAPAAVAAAPAAPADTDTRRPGTLDPAAAAKYQPAGSPATRTAAKSDPAVLKQQQDLIAKGAKIKADGVMGPATQAAIKQFAAAPAAATRSAASGTVASAGGGRGFVNPTAANTAAVAAAKPAAPAKPVAKLPAPQTGAAGQAARAAAGKAPTQVASRQSQSAVMESQEINRMRFLAGLAKD